MKGMRVSGIIAFALFVSFLFSVPARAQDKKEASPPYEIVRPAASQILTGIQPVEVRIVDESLAMNELWADPGRAPAVLLKPSGSGKVWKGRIDTRLYPNGNILLMIKGSADGKKRLDQPVSVRIENPLNCYFGDVHAHTWNSDGTSLPARAFAFARETAKLDFFFLTDHLEQVDHQEWQDVRTQAEKACEDGKFIAFAGLEWTKKTGHALIFEPDTRMWPDEAGGFFEMADRLGAFAMFNHPGKGEKAWEGLVYSENGDKVMRLMEVRSDDEEQAYLRALKNGWHIAAAGSDDTHSPNWGMQYAWTGILAPGLSRQNVCESLRSRHCFSTTDRNCRLEFRANDALMGDRIQEPVSEVRFRVQVADPDKSDRIAAVVLYEDGIPIDKREPAAASDSWEKVHQPSAGSHFYFVKVIQADGQKQWSAPIWLTSPGDHTRGAK